MPPVTPIDQQRERWGALWGARAERTGPRTRSSRPRPTRRRFDGSGSMPVSACSRSAAARASSCSSPQSAVRRSTASTHPRPCSRSRAPRVPVADLRVGDMEVLPHEDGFFDLVTGFNSFFFADDMVAALREAGRVAKPGAPVVIQVWGRPERCDLDAMKQAACAVPPAARPTRRSPPICGSRAPSRARRPRLASRRNALRLGWAYEYPDEDDARPRDGRCRRPRRVADAARRESRARRDRRGARAYRTPSGGYRLENEWHTLILVSEVMLQQTQVERVIPRYLDEMNRWPSVNALASAAPGDAIREWQGLGYNRRALNLHRAACVVAERGWPVDLTELPGVGPYTAAAMRNFAFREEVLPVDVNVERVLRRTGFEFAPGSAQALMDLGATVCLARVPRCSECPLAPTCPSEGRATSHGASRARSRGRFVNGGRRRCAWSRRRNGTRRHSTTRPSAHWNGTASSSPQWNRATASLQSSAYSSLGPLPCSHPSTAGVT